MSREKFKPFGLSATWNACSICTLYAHSLSCSSSTLCIAECGICSFHYTMLGGDKLLPLFFEIGLWIHEVFLCLQYNVCLHSLFKQDFNGMFRWSILSRTTSSNFLQLDCRLYLYKSFHATITTLKQKISIHTQYSVPSFANKELPSSNK